MHVPHLRLIRFRNFSDETFDFGPAFNVIVGDNAQGKTNMLEAVSFLSTGKSFRNNDWHDLIQQGKGDAMIEAGVEHAQGSDFLRAILRGPRKTFERNGKPSSPRGFARLGTVLFAPEEILLIRTQPAARRKFVDTLIERFSPAHHKLVRDYEAVVAQRNRLLNEEGLHIQEQRKLLAPWDDQIVVYGAKIMLARHQWIQRINALLPAHYREIAENDEAARFAYEPRAAAGALYEGEAAVVSALARELDMRRTDEAMRRTTLVGPHRDDCTAYIGDGAVKRFASQGQHRSFILALKTAEADMFREEHGEHPILLLDDVASELDHGRNKRFFAYIGKVPGQAFITTTEQGDVRLALHGDAATFRILNGRAVRR